MENILEKTILKKLEEFFEENNILLKFQSKFRTVVFIVVQQLYKSVLQNGQIIEIKVNKLCVFGSNNSAFKVNSVNTKTI